MGEIMPQPDLSKLREDASYCFKRADEISKQIDSEGLLNDEQKTEIKDLHKEGNGYLGQISAVEDTQVVQQNAASAYEQHLRPQERQVPQAQPGDSDGYSVNKIEMLGLSPRRYESFKGNRGEENAHKAGVWFASKMATWNPNLADHTKVIEAKRIADDHYPELRALGTTTNAAGGALVPQELASAIIERREQYGVFERLTSRVPVTGEALWPRVTSDNEAAFGNEGTTITESDDTFDDVALNPKSLRMLTRINNELLNSTPVDIAEFVARSFGRGFAKRIDRVGFIANLEVANGGLKGAFQKIQDTTGLEGNVVAAGNTFLAVTTGNLQSLLGKLPEYAAASDPFWICSRAAKEIIFGRLQMASGGVTKAETALGTLDTYSGVPIATTQLAPKSEAAMTTNDVFLLLADLQLASYLGVAEDLVFATSSERYFDVNQTAIRGIMRADVNVYDIGTTSNAGSVVGLRST
jgi:HK97 family phage major capsid protein